MVRGETQYNKLSRFVKEIPMELIDTGNKKIEKETEIPVQNTYSHAKQAFRAQPFAAQFGGYGSGRASGPSGTAGGIGKEAGKQPFSALQKGSQLTAGKGGKLSYGVGDRVRHVKFGEGTVLEIKEGGRDYEVTVQFDSAGVRKMFAMFAKLVKVS